jgi:hypothetical protein
LLTPIALRSTFNIVSPQDIAEGLVKTSSGEAVLAGSPDLLPGNVESARGETPSDQIRLRVAVRG